MGIFSGSSDEANNIIYIESPINENLKKKTLLCFKYFKQIASKSYLGSEVCKNIANEAILMLKGDKENNNATKYYNEFRTNRYK